MPKTSKVHKTAPKPHTKKQNSSQPGDPVPKPERASFFCCRCGTEFKKQERNFPASQSTLFRGNGGYLPVCNKCLDELYEHYKFALGGDMEAIQRLCLKFDIYWHPKIYEITLSGNTSSSRIRNYISRTNLYRFIGKTYDNTLDELNENTDGEEDGVDDCGDSGSKDNVATPLEQDTKTNNDRIVIFENTAQEERIITDDIRRYWGSGFTPAMYADLEDRREYWLSRYPDGAVLDPGEDALLKQICNLEIEINIARMSDKPIDRMVATLNSLIGSMNLKPSQKKETEDLNHTVKF